MLIDVLGLGPLKQSLVQVMSDPWLGEEEGVREEEAGVCRPP